jgi:dTDP-4-dehydrorhamnose 3,5-epimerase
MQISETDITGAYLIQPTLIHDRRGFFARTWDRATFEDRGLVTALEQCSLSFNARAGTLRGMHWQVLPYTEEKLVRCTAGAIYDVIVDLRRGSPSYLRHVAVELRADNHTALYIPAGCAHGFQTLTDGTEVAYQISQIYSAPHARSAHHTSPAFGIAWPLPVSVISERDAAAPLWQEEA